MVETIGLIIGFLIPVLLAAAGFAFYRLRRGGSVEQPSDIELPPATASSSASEDFKDVFDSRPSGRSESRENPVESDTDFISDDYASDDFDSPSVPAAHDYFGSDDTGRFRDRDLMMEIEMGEMDMFDPRGDQTAIQARAPEDLLKSLSRKVNPQNHPNFGQDKHKEEPLSIRQANEEDFPGDWVDCTVFAPPKVRVETPFLVQVFAHPPDDAALVQDLALEFDEDSRRLGFKSLSMSIVRGTRLTFELTSRDLQIEDGVEYLVWNGRPEAVQFEVEVPAGSEKSNVIGTVRVYATDQLIPVGHVRFKVGVVAHTQSLPRQEMEPTGDGATRYKRAFLSYASVDRTKVVDYAQLLKVLKIGFFQDLIDLDPGDRWEKELYRKIDESDLFLLFWSTAAKNSEWVHKEARYAVDRKEGDDFMPPEFRPIILEGPPAPLPWEDFADYQFNSPLLYFRSA